MSESPVPAPAPAAASVPPKPENLWLNLLCNVVVPVAVLSALSKPERLGPVWALVVAVAFPLIYGAYDLITRRKWNFLSLLGLLSVAITGGFGLMKVSGFWFAVKDGAVPALFGCAVIGSLWTKSPLARTLLLNDQLIDTARINAALAERNSTAGFNRLLVNATWMLGGAFFLSAALNYTLARIILKSPAGTPEFNAELGKMSAVSHFVLILPFLAILFGALWYVLSGLRGLTGLTLDDIFREPPKKDAAPAS